MIVEDKRIRFYDTWEVRKLARQQFYAGFASGFGVGAFATFLVLLWVGYILG